MAVLGKIELGDRDRLLVHRLTEALNKLADEIHTYNHPPVEFAVSRDERQSADIDPTDKESQS